MDVMASSWVRGNIHSGPGSGAPDSLTGYGRVSSERKACPRLGAPEPGRAAPTCRRSAGVPAQRRSGRSGRSMSLPRELSQIDLFGAKTGSSVTTRRRREHESAQRDSVVQALLHNGDKHDRDKHDGDNHSVVQALLHNGDKHDGDKHSVVQGLLHNGGAAGLNARTRSAGVPAERVRDDNGA